MSMDISRIICMHRTVQRKFHGRDLQYFTLVIRPVNRLDVP